MAELSKEDIIKLALTKAKEEGFRDAKYWEEREILSWYKALLKFENKRIPKLLKKYKDNVT